MTKKNYVEIDTKITIWERTSFYTNLSKKEVIEALKEGVSDKFEKEENYYSELMLDTTEVITEKENNFQPVTALRFQSLEEEEEEGYKEISLEKIQGTYTNLSFSDALVLLKEGYKIKVPEWIGYWKLENNVIMAYCGNNGCVEPANQFANHILRNDWIAKKC